MHRYHKLTDKQKQIIVDKGTEPPGSGAFDQKTRLGVYTCAQCDQPLYLSTDKFESGCGWPSFDDEIRGAITRQVDTDGHRTEILCSRCEGHLGHVFEGEGITEKGVRHCVNSVSMDFLSATSDEGYERIIVAGGCFWGIQHHLKQLDGVMEAVSGYTGGKVVFPSYEEVCTGNTGHYEAVEVLYDPAEISLEEILTSFAEIAGKGPDKGAQYRVAIFYFSEDQKDVAAEFGIKLIPASRFYPAEDYHQDYLEKNR